MPSSAARLPRLALDPPAAPRGRTRRAAGERRYPTDYDGLDLELFVCTEILGLDSLHYGLWEPGDPATIEGVRTAQARYTRRLLDLIPGPPGRLLDVGCGTGDVARAFASTGHRVTAISPDRNHGRFFQPPAAGVRFVPSRFEAFDAEEGFESILMSESQNYFEADAGFRQCRRYLLPGGHLLVSGMFRRGYSDAFCEVINVERPFVRGARSHGLSLVERWDISRETAPTLALLRDAMARYLPPLVEGLEQFLRATSPWKSRALALLFSRQLRDLRHLREYYLERTDPDAFLGHVRYLQLLFRAG